MADLSYLPPMADAPELDVLDLDGYQPPTEGFATLPVGNYLVRLIDASLEKEVTDTDGSTRTIRVPILFDLTQQGYLKATYSLEVVGQIVRNPDKTETVTDAYAGRKINFQRINRTPFSKGNRKGADQMTDMLVAFGFKGSIAGTTRSERNQEYADALQDHCLGKTAKARIILRRGVDTGEVKDGKKVYKEFKNADFDANGEVEYNGEMIKGYNEVDGFFAWNG